MKIAVVTLGCRLNFAETQEIIENFEKEGFEISFKKPTLIIVRGCSVTRKAEKETRLKIKELRKKEKRSFIIATGCLRENFFSSESNLILPKNREKELFNEIKKIFGNNLNLKIEKNRKIKLRTRYFLKIQDGCQRYCSYCLVPYLRGKENSRPFEEIIEKIKEKENEGYKEIVLTGVNIDKWSGGRNRDLFWLVKEILKKTNILRIRFSSLWPTKINAKFLSLFKSHRICQYLHLSLQSLSDFVLKKMGRNYRVEEIKDKIEKIRKNFPDLTLTADIIVGFPFETENEFNKTYKNLKELRLSKIHVFRYSLREGTKAENFQNQIDEKIKKERAKVLIDLSKKLEKEWRKRFLGKTKEVLFEKKKDGFWQGLTDNYLKVYVKSDEDLNNQILPVELKRLYKDGILGKTKNKKQ